MYLTGVIQRDRVFKLATRWLCDWLEPEDGRFITEVFIYESMASGPTVRRFHQEVLAAVHTGEFRRHRVYVKDDVRRSIVECCRQPTVKMQALFEQYRVLPEEFFPRTRQTELVLDPLEWIHQVVQQIPAPRQHLVRYYGAYSNRKRRRLPQAAQAAASMPPAGPAEEEPASHQTRPSWARMLHKIFSMDALRCPRCSTAMVILALISDPPVITKILRHLGLPTEPPPTSPTRASWEPPPFALSPPRDDPARGDLVIITSGDDILIPSPPPMLSPPEAARPPP